MATKDPRKPAAESARTGGSTDLTSGSAKEKKRDLGRLEPHPQGAGGIDVAEDASPEAKEKTKDRLKRVIW